MPRSFPISLLALALASPLSAAGPEVTYLANEGFLLRCGETRVLIDAFVTEPYSEYAAVPAETWRRMLDREPPFEQVALALVSHVHRDHVQPGAAVEFLIAHPETRLITSPEVVAALRAVEGFSAIAERVEAVLPEPGETLTREAAGVRVDFLRLLHTAERNRAIENLGHVIHLCEGLVLHVGDAAVLPESFAPYRLAERKIDLALLPFWFDLEEEGPGVLASLGAKHRAACHVPPGEVGKWTRALQETAPEVQVFGRPGEALPR